MIPLIWHLAPPDMKCLAMNACCGHVCKYLRAIYKWRHPNIPIFLILPSSFHAMKIPQIAISIPPHSPSEVTSFLHLTYLVSYNARNTITDRPALCSSRSSAVVVHIFNYMCMALWSKIQNGWVKNIFCTPFSSEATALKYRIWRRMLPNRAIWKALLVISWT